MEIYLANHSCGWYPVGKMQAPGHALVPKVCLESLRYLIKLADATKG